MFSGPARTGPPYRGALLTYLICSSNGTLVQVTVSIEEARSASLSHPVHAVELDKTLFESWPRHQQLRMRFYIEANAWIVPRCRPRPPPSKCFLGSTSHNIKELCILLTEGAFMFRMLSK